MKISFHGAARTVTGSKHLLTTDDGQKILLDCGMFQGLGRDTAPLNADFGFSPEQVDAVLLSHAHIDHSGLLPKLIKEGFRGKIYCTPATKELTDILLHDSAEIQAYEAEHFAKKGMDHEPLYLPADVEETMKHFITVEFDEWFQLSDTISFLFTNTGHLVGSAAISLTIKEDHETVRLLYSGDVGKYRSILLQAPAEAPQADYIILESTHGNKHHDISFNTIETLHQWIKKVCVAKGGQIIIPAFSVGRTQEVLYALNQLSLEKRLPDIPVFVDSPLSLKATQTIKHYKDQFNDRLQQVLRVDDDPFDFPGLKHIETVEESRKLVDYEGPCVIISASGTADAGRVRHHINSCIAKENCAVLLVGYCGIKSLGGQLAEGAKEVEIFGEPCAVKAEVGQVHGMSAHGDTDDLCRFIANQDTDTVRQIFLVHGEYPVQKAFCDRLGLKGFKNVEVPAQHEQVELGSRKLKERAA